MAMNWYMKIYLHLLIHLQCAFLEFVSKMCQWNAYWLSSKSNLCDNSKRSIIYHIHYSYIRSHSLNTTTNSSNCGPVNIYFGNHRVRTQSNEWTTMRANENYQYTDIVHAYCTHRTLQCGEYSPRMHICSCMCELLKPRRSQFLIHSLTVFQ